MTIVEILSIAHDIFEFGMKIGVSLGININLFSHLFITPFYVIISFAQRHNSETTYNESTTRDPPSDKRNAPTSAAFDVLGVAHLIFGRSAHSSHVTQLRNHKS